MKYRYKILWVGLPLMRPMVFGRRYQLVEDLEVVWQVRGGPARRHVVPAGFVTDGASIPPAFWQMIGSPYAPEFITAAVVHDHMCELGWDVMEMSDLFLSLLIDSNVGRKKAAIMRASVYLYKSTF